MDRGFSERTSQLIDGWGANHGLTLPGTAHGVRPGSKRARIPDRETTRDERSAWVGRQVEWKTMLRRSGLIAGGVAAVEIGGFLLAATRVDVLPLLLAFCAASLVGSFLLVRTTKDFIRQSLGDVASATPGGARKLGDRGLVVLAALLLTIPGFVTGAAGLLLFLPPVRALFSGRVAAAIGRRVADSLDRSMSTATANSTAFGDLSRSIRRSEAVDVTSTTVDSSTDPQPPRQRPELR